MLNLGVLEDFLSSLCHVTSLVLHVPEVLKLIVLKNHNLTFQDLKTIVLLSVPIVSLMTPQSVPAVKCQT